MYAIINISGKQYKASEGARVRVPKQSGDEGSTLTFNDVLLFSDGKIHRSVRLLYQALQLLPLS